MASEAAGGAMAPGAAIPAGNGVAAGAEASVVIGKDAAHPGVRALGLIDAVIAAKPEKDDAKLALVVENVCAWRREMTRRRDARRWDDAAERDLGTLNGALSLVLAIHFPLGEVRWDELETCRTVLAELAGRAEVAA